MRTIYLRSRVGADGILQLRVPTDGSNAELDVMVVVTPVACGVGSFIPVESPDLCPKQLMTSW
jgi:hypothetical protein